MSPQQGIQCVKCGWELISVIKLGIVILLNRL